MDTEGQIARITESKEKRAMMMYQKVILFICIVILGFLGFMAYSGISNTVSAIRFLNFKCSGSTGNSIVQDYDQDIQQRLLEDLMLDLLRMDQSKNNSLTHEVFYLIKTKSSYILLFRETNVIWTPKLVSETMIRMLI